MMPFENLLGTKTFKNFRENFIHDRNCSIYEGNYGKLSGKSSKTKVFLLNLFPFFFLFFSPKRGTELWYLQKKLFVLTCRLFLFQKAQKLRGQIKNSSLLLYKKTLTPLHFFSWELPFQT
jgi:hypothetical protein